MQFSHEQCRGAFLYRDSARAPTRNNGFRASAPHEPHLAAVAAFSASVPMYLK